MIIVYNSFFQDYHELIDAIYEMSHYLWSDYCISVIEAYEIDEFSSDMEEHAIWVVEVFFEHHWKLQKDF